MRIRSLLDLQTLHNQGYVWNFMSLCFSNLGLTCNYLELRWMSKPYCTIMWVIHFLLPSRLQPFVRQVGAPSALFQCGLLVQDRLQPGYCYLLGTRFSVSCFMSTPCGNVCSKWLNPKNKKAVWKIKEPTVFARTSEDIPLWWCLSC